MSSKSLPNRRVFLKTVGFGTLSGVLAACAQATQQPAAAPVQVEVEVTREVQVTTEVEVTRAVEVVVTATPAPKPPAMQVMAPTVTPQPEPPVDLAFWDWYGRLVWNSQDLKQVQVDAWNAANPNIRVNYLPNAGAKEKVLTAVASGSPPDLLLTDPPADYVYRGALEPLQPYLDLGNHPFIQDSIYPGVWQAMEYEGQVYGVHKVVNNGGLYINADLFWQAGLDPDAPPTNLNELEEYALKVQKTDSQGNIDILGFSPWMNIAGIWGTWAEAFGAQMWDAQNRQVTFDEPASIRALEWQVEYARKLGGYEKILEFNDSLQGGVDPFGSGRVAMYYTGPWQIGIMQDNYPAINYRTARAPVPDGGRPGSWLGGSWLVIPKGAKHRDLAWEFLRFYCGRDAQNYEGTQGIGFSIFPEDNAANEWFKSVKPLQPFIEDLPNCWPIPLIPTVSHAFFTAYNPMVDEALRGKRTPEEAMKEASRLAQAEVDRFLTR